MLRRRELRVACVGVAAVSAAFVLTLCAPLWLLALGPIVWGAPHLLADVRYLVVRPGYHRRAAVWLCVFVPVAAAGLGASASVGVLSGVGAAIAARASGHTRIAAAGVCLALAYGLFVLGRHGDVLFAHAHNFIAVACWLAWRRRHSHAHWAVLMLFVGLSVAIASGAADPWLAALGGLRWAPARLGLPAHIAQLAPGMHGDLGRRLVLLFAFAQAVHYAVWIRLIPEEDRTQDTPRPFRATLRALRADFGAWPLRCTAVLALGLAVWAVLDLHAARAGYLRLALFHGHMEVAALVLLAIEGTLPWAGRLTSR